MTPQALIAPARLAGAPLMRTQSDERLVDLVRAGNVGAFEAIVARYRRALLRYCCQLMPEARAEDVVQQTFVRAYDALRASEGDMSLRPWLYRIAHNQSLNALRDRALGHEELSESIDGVERPDQALENRERLHDVMAAVSLLPERQRDAIVLRELEGRSYEEIAAELGVTGGAVRQLLNRARGTLRSGMTAVVPFGLLARAPFAPVAGGDVGVRVGELCGAGAGAAVATKLCATAIVTGAVMGGVATVPSGGPEEGRASPEPERVERQREEPPAPTARTESGEDTERSDAGGQRGRGGDEGEDRSGPRDGADRDGDRSGRRGGDDDGGNDDREEDRSGPGGDDGAVPQDNSGPGSGGDAEGERVDSSGPGSGVAEGVDNSGSGSSSSGSGSGDPLDDLDDSSGSGSD